MNPGSINRGQNIDAEALKIKNKQRHLFKGTEHLLRECRQKRKK
jgi:hypothetical protein